MTTVVTSISAREIISNLTKIRNLGVRNKNSNAQEWLRRREKDAYVEISRQENYRCRSAYKLIEIDDKYKLIKPGCKVLDVGAAPGSWSQVLAKRTNSDGKDENSPVGLVIAIDKTPFHGIDGVTMLPLLDFTEKSSQDKILEILGEGQKLDYVFSDMAPSASGVKSIDQENIVKLIYPVIFFSVNNLKVGGGCLFKIWASGEDKNLRNNLKRFFKYVNTVKPKASYSNSAEAFILAREFVGLKTAESDQNA